jgi:hypothetical protein
MRTDDRGRGVAVQCPAPAPRGPQGTTERWRGAAPGSCSAPLQGGARWLGPWLRWGCCVVDGFTPAPAAAGSGLPSRAAESNFDLDALAGPWMLHISTPPGARLVRPTGQRRSAGLARSEPPTLRVPQRYAEPPGPHAAPSQRRAADRLKLPRCSPAPPPNHTFPPPRSMINLGVVELLAHPDQLAALHADPEGLIKPAVEEICRYHTASSFALRRWVLWWRGGRFPQAAAATGLGAACPGTTPSALSQVPCPHTTHASHSALARIPCPPSPTPHPPVPGSHCRMSTLPAWPCCRATASSRPTSRPTATRTCSRVGGRLAG